MNLKMSASLFLLFSHRLTLDQEADLKSLGISTVIYMPKQLQSIWSGISPYGRLPVAALSIICNWLINNAQINDFVLVQGDFGAVFIW